jgi:hypothetical protein
MTRRRSRINTSGVLTHLERHLRIPIVLATAERALYFILACTGYYRDTKSRLDDKGPDACSLEAGITYTTSESCVRMRAYHIDGLIIF